MSLRPLSAVIPIGEPVRDLCRRLDVDPDEVREITITPSAATVTVFSRNEHGSFFHIDGEVQTETREFEVTVA